MSQRSIINEMKFELSHDILAKKVYEKSSQEDKMLRKIEAFIRERYEYFVATGVMLGKKDLEYIGRYLDNVNITPKQEKFIADSQRRVRRSEGRKIINALLLVVMPILIGLLGWALWQTYEAQTALNKVKVEKKRADDNAKTAVAAQKIALKEKEEADEARAVAVEQRNLAEVAKVEAVKQAQKAKVQARRAEAAKREAERQKNLATQAAKAAKVAKKRADEAAEKARNNEKIAVDEKQRADGLAQKAKLLQKEAEKAARQAQLAAHYAEEEAKKATIAQRESRALYLASLADNALRLDKGIVAYNLAKLSWNMEKNLMAQKVLFDCQNAYTSNKKLFEEYKQKEKGYKTYMEQSKSQFDMKAVQRNLNDWGTNLLNRIDFGNAFDIAKFSPNRKMIATVLFRKKNLKIRNTTNGAVLMDINTPAKIKSFKFSEDNQYLVVILEDNSAELRKINANGTLLGKFQHDITISSAEFCPNNGDYIATVSADNVGKLWNNGGKLIKEFKVHHSDFSVLPYSDGKRVLRLSEQGFPEILNVFTNQARALKVQKQSRSDNVVKVIFSPDGQYILTQTQGGTVELWKIDGTPKAKINHKGKLDIAKFSPDGDEILTSSNQDNFAELWDLNGKPLGKFYFSGIDPINSVEFSDDGLRVLIGRSGIANLWGAKGRLLYSFDPDKPIASASFSADNKSVLVATRDGGLDIWNIVRPKEIIDYYENIVKIRRLTPNEKVEYGVKDSDFVN